jgi:terminase, large subunit
MTPLDAALDQAQRTALAPPPLLSLAQWSEKNARIPAAGNAQPGRWSAYPYQVGWLEAISDPRVRQVAVMKSSRVGYTRCLLNAIGFYVDQDPSPILVVLPRESDCEDFSRSDVLSTLLETPALASIVGDYKSRDANQRIMKRMFKNGASIAFVGANSPAGFRRISAKVLLVDECDGFPLEAGAEGDQISLAIKRTESFWSRRIVIGSTPTLKYQSRIERAFLEGDQRHYHVPCPHCGTFQVLHFENLHWDKTESGEHLPHTAHFICSRHGCIIEEHHKPSMIAAGEWRAEKPFNGRASFHLWTAYSPHPNATWASIASEFLEASKDPVLLRTHYNVTRGLPWEDRGSGKSWEELATRARQSAYKRGAPPPGACLLFLGLDVQIDRIEWLLVGRGAEHKKYIIDWGTVARPIGEADAQRALDQLLNRRWKNHAGREIGITLAAIDAGFETDTVLEYCRRHGPNKLLAVRGIAGDHVPRIAKVARERNEKRGTLLKHPRGNYFNVGTHTLKTGLFLDLAKDDPATPGYIAFPSDIEDRVLQELCSEQRIAVKRMGQIVFRWEKISDRQPNEMLDCFCYSAAAQVKYGCSWISPERWREMEAELGTPTVPPKPGEKRVARSAAERISDMLP